MKHRVMCGCGREVVPFTPACEPPAPTRLECPGCTLQPRHFRSLYPGDDAHCQCDPTIERLNEHHLAAIASNLRDLVSVTRS